MKDFALENLGRAADAYMDSMSNYKALFTIAFIYLWCRCLLRAGATKEINQFVRDTLRNIVVSYNGTLYPHVAV